MLKNTAVLALILTVAQTTVPTPPHTVNGLTRSRQNVEARIKSDQQATSSDVTAADQNKPPSVNGNGKEQIRSDASHSIVVTKFPSVSVNRDWADWGVWAFSGLLVIVGFLQVYLSRGTLAAIKRQADLLENAERARITIVVSRLGNYSFEFNAKNIGKTNARIFYARGFRTSLDAGESLPEVPIYLSGEPVINEPEEWIGAGADLTLVRQKEDGKCDQVLIADLGDSATRNNIQLNRCSMWIYGRVCYLDGISPLKRESRFCYGVAVDSQGTTLVYPGGPTAYRFDS